MQKLHYPLCLLIHSIKIDFVHHLISGYDANARLIEEEDSACPTLLEQDFNRFHHTIPGLRRSGVDANAIRQVSEGNEIKMRALCSSVGKQTQLP